MDVRTWPAEFMRFVPFVFIAVAASAAAVADVATAAGAATFTYDAPAIARDDVHLGGNDISARLSQHEYQHVLDLESTGGLAFYGTYVAQSAWQKATTGNGYDGIVWERRADGRSAIAGGQSSIGRDATSVAGRATGVAGRYASNAVGGAVRRGVNAWNAREKLMTNWRYR